MIIDFTHDSYLCHHVIYKLFKRKYLFFTKGEAGGEGGDMKGRTSSVKIGKKVEI